MALFVLLSRAYDAFGGAAEPGGAVARSLPAIPCQRSLPALPGERRGRGAAGSAGVTLAKE